MNIISKIITGIITIITTVNIACAGYKVSLFGVDTTGEVNYYYEGVWYGTGLTNVHDIAISNNGLLFANFNDNTVKRYTIDVIGNGWDVGNRIALNLNADYGCCISSIAVSGNTIVGRGLNGNAYWSSGGGWTNMGGVFADGERIFAYLTSNNKWYGATGSSVYRRDSGWTLANSGGWPDWLVNINGQLWGQYTDGNIWQVAGGSDVQEIDGGGLTLKSPVFDWADGDLIYMLDSAGDLYSANFSDPGVRSITAMTSDKSMFSVQTSFSYVTIAPEPSSTVLVIMGVLALATRRRRKRSL